MRSIFHTCALVLCHLFLLSPYTLGQEINRASSRNNYGHSLEAETNSGFNAVASNFTSVLAYPTRVLPDLNGLGRCRRSSHPVEVESHLFCCFTISAGAEESVASSGVQDRDMKVIYGLQGLFAILFDTLPAHYSDQTPFPENDRVLCAT